MAKKIIKPDYLFEVSWEVCNKVGGIYTVIATKSLYLSSEFKRNHIMVGPDVWMDTESNPSKIRFCIEHGESRQPRKDSAYVSADGTFQASLQPFWWTSSNS